VSALTRLWKWRFAAVGIAFGLVVSEIALRTISTPYFDLSAVVDIAADNTDSVAYTLKWYHEGIATSHFSVGTARLTGNPFIQSAPVGVIMGDSYVEALQIPDRETMGAVVERLARTNSTPLNVRQFGWALAAPATYVARASAVLARWNPAWVVVVLNAQDLDPTALADAPKSRISPDTSLEITGPLVLPTTLHGWHLVAKDVSEALAKRSVLANEGANRAWRIHHADDRAVSLATSRTTNARVNGTVESPDIDIVTIASVRSLHRAFGHRLAIVFVPTVTATDSVPEPEERALLDACEREGVTCTTTRAAMIALRNDGHRLARGLTNAPPLGGQHPNALGHELIGRAIWNLVSASERQSAVSPTRSESTP
jgi:hypothetical protein